MHPCKYKARIALAFAITLGSLFLQSSLSSRTLFAQTKSQQNRKQKQERKIQRALNKLEDAKGVFDGKRVKLKKFVLDRFDQAIASVNASGWRIDVRTNVIKQLKEAKESFRESGELEKIPAFQQTFVTYIGESLVAYSDLMNAYEKAMKHVPSEDIRFEVLEGQIADYDAEVNGTDAFQVGSVWKGYRSDFEWGPGYKITKGENSVARLTKFRNDRVDVSFQLEVKNRNGTFIEVEISQNNKRFIALAEGTFDGVNLNIGMTRMKKGVERYFEYSGQIAGFLGVLALRGRKTNGALTTGKIVLEAVDD